jgi:hypothetical protein
VCFNLFECRCRRHSGIPFVLEVWSANPSLIRKGYFFFKPGGVVSGWDPGRDSGVTDWRDQIMRGIRGQIFWDSADSDWHYMNKD